MSTTLRNTILAVPMLFIGAVIVYAAAPAGGYAPNATLDPDCAPGDTDCFVKPAGGVVDEPWFGTDDDAGATTNTENIYTLGDVGIGTADPVSILDIAEAGTRVRFDNGSLYFDSSTKGIFSSVNGDNQDASIILRDSSSGDILITPSDAGGQQRDTIVTIGNVGVGNANPDVALDLRDADMDTAIKLRQSNGNNGSQITYDTANLDLELWNRQNGDISFYTRSGQEENMRIEEGGNVGIGIVAPTATLHIKSDSDASLTSTGHGLTIGADTGVNLILDRNEIIVRDNGSASNLFLQATDSGQVSVGGGSVYPAKLNVDADTSEAMPSLSVSGPDAFGDIVTNAGESLGLGHWDDTTSVFTERISFNSAGNIEISDLAGAHAGGSAFVCVDTAGELFTSEVACP